jgi:hypothetical protein
VLSRNKKAASEEAAQDDPYSVVVFKLPRSGLVQGGLSKALDNAPCGTPLSRYVMRSSSITPVGDHQNPAISVHDGGAITAKSW